MVLTPPIKYDSIEIITGCMFSGKTEELIKRINNAKALGLNTAVFKPEIDNRYDNENIVSHNGTRIERIAVKNSYEILNFINGVEIIGLDEAQFFDAEIIENCKIIASQKIKIIISGLEKDFMYNPFGPMPGLISISKNITHLAAICHQCGDKAFHTFKKIKSESIIEIGENDIYEARCLACYQKGLSEQLK
ncbi:MAG: thymidine kinase [Bacteroidia bacterium]